MWVGSPGSTATSTSPLPLVVGHLDMVQGLAPGLGTGLVVDVDASAAAAVLAPSVRSQQKGQACCVLGLVSMPSMLLDEVSSQVLGVGEGVEGGAAGAGAGVAGIVRGQLDTCAGG